MRGGSAVEKQPALIPVTQFERTGFRGLCGSNIATSHWKKDTTIMPSKAMILAPDSQNPSTYGLNDRPDVYITTAGRMALIPSMDELLSRRGAKGLQLTLEEMGHHHFMMHSYDWIYANGKIHSQGQGYFVLFSGDVHYLGKYNQAVDFLTDYARTGKPNHALRRMR